MTAVETIEQQVQKLSPKEFAQFRDWFMEHEWDAWDRQLEKDVKAGRLDGLARKARADHAAGRTQPL
ncbi:MAG: hypothetical protein ACRETW_11050 [Stenotrophobium sp.]